MNKCQRYYFVLALFVMTDKMPRMGHPIRNGVELYVFFSSTYSYNADQAALNMSGTATRSYTYDGYGRLSRTVTDNILTTDYTYRTVNAGGTDYATTQIAAVQNTYAGAEHGYTYTYDNNGNILTVSDGTNTTSYCRMT